MRAIVRSKTLNEGLTSKLDTLDIGAGSEEAAIQGRASESVFFPASGECLEGDNTVGPYRKQEWENWGPRNPSPSLERPSVSASLSRDLGFHRLCAVAACGPLSVCCLARPSMCPGGSWSTCDQDNYFCVTNMSIKIHID